MPLARTLEPLLPSARPHKLSVPERVAELLGSGELGLRAALTTELSWSSAARDTLCVIH